MNMREQLIEWAAFNAGFVAGKGSLGDDFTRAGAMREALEWTDTPAGRVRYWLTFAILPGKKADWTMRQKWQWMHHTARQSNWRAVRGECFDRDDKIERLVFELTRNN